jgi:glycosyltransferase involved in cell wall biosynthesis
MITWRGFCDDIVSELRRLDLLALPSLYGEGMPMVVLEAMSVGLPIVASRIEGVPQLVRDRQDGLLVSPNNAKELSEALQFFLDNPEARSHMGERGRERQATHFSAQSTATAVARIYDELLATEETGVRPQIQGA